MDENVVPLLKSIFDVLQMMREEKLHLGPIDSKNIHLDEPFNGLPPPPVPPSSPKIPKQLLEITCDSQSCILQSSRNSLKFKKETDRDFINNEDNLAIWEPPERDVEDFDKTYQETSTTSQRLIPVDMDLLRTDEELIWEPDSNFYKPEVESEDGNEREFSRLHSLELEDAKPLKTQFRMFPEEVNLQSRDKVSQLEDQSDEKLLKASELNKSNETLLPKVDIIKFDVGTDCPNFNNDIGTNLPDFANDERSSTKSSHCSQEPAKPQSQEMSQFIESILFDLKAMNSFRKNNSHRQSFARLPCASTGGWQRPSRDLSYPVTIESVQELGANSLFIKWRVQNFGNIGGYEIFLDGHLTNRYFNCIHQAAVICDVDLHCPHRITLRAQPLIPLRTSLQPTDSCSSSTSHTKYPSNTTTHPEASCPQPDGSVWYPSVYHFEPNALSAPINAVLY